MDLTGIYIGYMMLYARTKNPEHIKKAKVVREMRDNAEKVDQLEELKKEEGLSL